MGALTVGLGYRRALHAALLEAPVGALDFVELAPENYLGLGGEGRRRLRAVQERYPILTHGLSLSLGGEVPFDPDFLSALSAFTASVGAPWHSDHLSWSSSGDTPGMVPVSMPMEMRRSTVPLDPTLPPSAAPSGVRSASQMTGPRATPSTHFHELLPLPLTEAVADHVAARVRAVQDRLSVPFAVENVSAYARHPEDALGEGAFVSRVVEASGCGLLLDVNNVYVNALNFGGDPRAALEALPLERVVQIHIAGFTRESPDLVIDTHGGPVDEGVWPLLEAALARTGPVPVLLERDNHLPPLSELLAEVARIRAIGTRVLGSAP